MPKGIIKRMVVKKMKVMVETSAHHVHVTKETLKALFGEDAKLTNKKDLSQAGTICLC